MPSVLDICIAGEARLQNAARDHRAIVLWATLLAKNFMEVDVALF
jgi:hypothetical protein